MDELLKEYPVALSISDVAEILNITPSTVRRHIKSNDLPHIKIGKHVRIPKESLIVYLHGDQTPYKKGGNGMNEKNINLSLELLLLNDLLRTNAIDKDIYDKAAQKIVSAKKQAT